MKIMFIWWKTKKATVNFDTSMILIVLLEHLNEKPVLFIEHFKMLYVN